MTAEAAGRLQAFAEAWRNFLPGTDVIAEGPQTDDPQLHIADLSDILDERNQLATRVAHTTSLPGFTTRIEVQAAWDYRDNPSDGRGANGMMLHLVLTGDLGAIVASINTGWVLRPLAGPLTNMRPPLRRDTPGVDAPLTHIYPSGHGTFAHAKAARDGDLSGHDVCQYLDGAPCYGSGSYLATDKILHRLIEGGSEAAFAEMAALYQAWIAGAEPVSVSPS